MVEQTLLHPQEIEVYYIIPTLRRYFTKYMKDSGLSQKEIAKRLHLNESAVSQYLHEKRGHQLDFKEPIITEIKKSALKIENPSDLLREMQSLLRLIKNTKVLCDIHRKFSLVPEVCEPNSIGCEDHGRINFKH